MKSRILLVEDNEIIQLIHRKLLESLNCEVLVASNGQQALELYKLKPDLILLDIGLPNMSGLEVCSIIRQQEENCHTPIIALTAFGEEIAGDCINAGADDFSTKPITKNDLETLLQNWLKQDNTCLA